MTDAKGDALMNPMHQLTRRPVKAPRRIAAGLSGGDPGPIRGTVLAAVQTRAGVEETYTTVAVVTGG